MKTQRIYWLLIVFIVSCYGETFSQRFSERDPNRQDERTQEEQPHQVYFEASNFISDSMGKSRLDVSFRIPHDFFVFVRNMSDQKSFPFIAHGDITIEILDSANVSVGRELLTKELGANEPESHNAESQFLQGVFSFDLKPGRYTIVTEVKDHESSRHYFDNEKKIVLKDFSRTSTELSDIMFAEQSRRGEDSVLIPVNLGGNVPFGKNFDACVEFVTAHPAESVFISYNIFKNNGESHERTHIVGDTLRSNSFIAGTLVTLEKKEQGYLYRLTKSSHKENYTLLLHLQGDTLMQGNYEMELSLTSGQEIKSLTKPFRIRWVGMPHSLRNFSLALDALEYVMKEDEFKEIKAAAPSKQQKLFEEFWKKKDPTPTTAFNEAMAEYYRRVDYAMMNFVTVKQSNGMKTERGKAYILYGPPTRTEREMSPNAVPKEIWYYSSLNKKLIFADESHNGDYKLIAVEKLM